MMRPSVGVSSPATIRSVVVLPQPDGPSSAKKWPCGTTRSIASTAVKFANCFVSVSSRRSPPFSPFMVSATCDIGPFSFVSAGLLLVERHQVDGVCQHVLVGKDQLVVNEARIDLLHRLASALDGAGVVGPGA